VHGILYCHCLSILQDIGSGNEERSAAAVHNVIMIIMDHYNV
jgi:hypothetical protein